MTKHTKKGAGGKREGAGKPKAHPLKEASWTVGISVPQSIGKNKSKRKSLLKAVYEWLNEVYYKGEK